MSVFNPRLAGHISRRGILAAGGGIAGALLGGCIPGTDPGDGGSGVTDNDILNFALNLEYLEAEYYARAVGQSLAAADVGTNPGTVTGGAAVVFTDPNVQQLALELYSDELAHVRALRTALLGAAVSRPDIDFTSAFTAAARAAGVIDANATFDPFSSELNFLLGAFIFEDVGVTAYQGAAPLISSKLILAAALSIHATEAYHAGAVRTFLLQRGVAAQDAANKISDARDSLDGATDDDVHLTDAENFNFVAAPRATGLTFPRLATQVLNIVYLNAGAGVSAGGFFPNGVNGAIRTT